MTVFPVTTMPAGSIFSFSKFCCEVSVGAKCSLYLLVGMDAFAALDGWHRWRELLDFAHIVVMQRPENALLTRGAVAELLRERRVVLQEVGGEDAQAQPGGVLIERQGQRQRADSAVSEQRGGHSAAQQTQAAPQRHVPAAGADSNSAGYRGSCHCANGV